MNEDKIVEEQMDWLRMKVTLSYDSIELAMKRAIKSAREDAETKVSEACKATAREICDKFREYIHQTARENYELQSINFIDTIETEFLKQQKSEISDVSEMRHFPTQQTDKKGG